MIHLKALIICSAVMFVAGAPAQLQKPIPTPKAAIEGTTPFRAAANQRFQNRSVSWFAPQIYIKTNVGGRLEYWVRDDVKKNQDDRQRRYYIGFLKVSEGSLDYGPLLRGGVYRIRCQRWRGQVYETPANGFPKGNGYEAMFVDLTVPGPQGEIGSVAIPASFQHTAGFTDKHTSMLPPFSGLAGKINSTYRFRASDTFKDLYLHGDTHAVGDNDPKHSITTANPVNLTRTGILAGINAHGLPDDASLNLNNLGEQGLQQFSRAQMRAIADQQGKLPSIWFSDFEGRFSNFGSYYWTDGYDFNAGTLPRIYWLYERLQENNPTALLGDFIRNPAGNGVPFTRQSDGQPDPSQPRYREALTHPESLQWHAFRSFTDPNDGKTKSLRDIYDICVIDAYAKGASGDATNNYALYQPYWNVYQCLISKMLAPNKKVIWTSWMQHDGQEAGPFYIATPKGEASTILRDPVPFEWLAGCGLLANIVSDGWMWWSEQSPGADDPTRLTGDIDPAWNGTGANPFVHDNSSPPTPRNHEGGIAQVNLSLYRLKQVESSLNQGWTWATYRVDGGKLLVANGNQTILDWAVARAPMVFLLGKAGNRAVAAWNPFGQPNHCYSIDVVVDGGTNRMYLTGAWPTVASLTQTGANSSLVSQKKERHE